MLLKTVWLAGLLLSLTPTASRAADTRVTIDLPAAEDPAVWRAPLDLAGLSIAAEPTRATVQIRAVGAVWRVHTVVDGVITRTVDVSAPSTEQEREELAFLTRALARSMTPPGQPRGNLNHDRPPPPPPARRAAPPGPPTPTPAAVPTVGTPAAARTSPTPPAVTPAPEVTPEARAATSIPAAAPSPAAPSPVAPSRAAPPTDTSAPATPSAPTAASASVTGPAPTTAPPASETTPPVVASPPAREVRADPLVDPAPADAPAGRRWSTQAASPSMAVTVGIADRFNTVAGARFGLQVDLVESERMALGVEVGASPSRRLEMNLDRTIWDLNLSLVTSYNLDPYVRFEALAGVGYLAFRQQFVPIDEALTPQLGASAELHTGGGVGRVGLRARGRMDLSPITLIDERGYAEKLLPYELGVDLVFRLSALGDPNPSLPTLQGQ